MSSNNTYIKVSNVPDAQGVVLVQLARPPVNAFNQQMWEELGATFDRLSGDGNVKAIILASSSPKIWTAGLDLTDTQALNGFGEDPARRSVALRNHIIHFQNCITSIERCRQPVVAAVHGAAIGLGVDILCACDIRFAAVNATFCVKEIDVGMAADIGTLSRLPKVVGNQSAVKELTLTGRTFDAIEALSVGFVSKVVKGGRDDVIAVAIQVAHTISTKSPIAVMGIKHILTHARDNTVASSLEYTATWNSLMLQSNDTADAFAAFKTKKAPQFLPIPSAKL
ncbi:hypothetical protein FRB90_010050 [Tulasnella sp. 427]|nr:hypothetical protein FRB90_010050 [Tulasnella sp. 427]